MKHKFSSMGRVAIALVLALSLSLVMAVPVAASHDATATVAFTLDASTQQSTGSTLDVEVTSSAVSSLGNITIVKIDFTASDFTVTGTGAAVSGWTPSGPTADVVTYTAITDGDQIAPGDSLTFVPAVTNPATLGVATNPTVKTSDAGSYAELEATEATGWIGYIADASGTAGNDITVEYADAVPYSGLIDIVSVVGSAISVELADEGSGPTSTVTVVAAAINGDTDASTLVTATVESGMEAEIVPVMSATALSGGSLPQLDKPCPLTGTLTITEQLLVVAVTATPATSASLASYDIGFTTIGAIAPDETIAITFPAEYDLTGILLPADVTVTVNAVLYTTGTVTVIGPVVTIPAVAEIPAEVSAVVVTIANDHVKNPPASGDYDIAVLTTAGDHGTGEVTITPATFGVVAGTDDTVTAGTAFAVTVTALNAEAEPEIDIGYTGDHFIDFTWVVSPTGTPTIPAFELITFTAGVGTSPQYFVLTVAGEAPTIRAEEDGLFGISAAITINPATFAGFLIGGEPTSVVAGEDFGANDITVTAQDADGNTVTDYTGTVSWTSTDGQAVLPAASFTTEDEGVHTFLGSLFTLKTAGAEQTITVTDAAAEISQESASIAVTSADAASIVVAASPGVIEADGTVDSSTITATAKDEFGNVDTDYVEIVTFEASLGTLPEVDANFTAGVATATLKSSDVGIATIRVTSGTLPDAMTTVKLLPDIGITTIDVTVDKDSISNNGVDERTITATYKDTGGDVVTAAEGADYAFTFSVADEDTVLSTTDPVNPVAGVATVTLTTTIAAGLDAIEVTADGTGADDGSETLDVTEGALAITLYQGWNLISLPLIPTDSDIDAVLAGADVTVNKVAYYTGGPAGSWLNYSPPAPGNLDTMNDGKGYWIDVTLDGGTELIVTGVQLALPGQSPPTYDVVVGWNLIGFTSTTDYNIVLYLGAVMDTVQAMYKYNAATGLYEPILTETNLESGQGYWLAVNADGKIYP